MRVHCGLPKDWSKIPDAVRRAETDGFEGLNAAETSHNPFLPLMLAAEQGSTLKLSAVGEDAEAAVEALADLVKRGFEEN